MAGYSALEHPDDGQPAIVSEQTFHKRFAAFTQSMFSGFAEVESAVLATSPQPGAQLRFLLMRSQRSLRVFVAFQWHRVCFASLLPFLVPWFCRSLCFLRAMIQ